MDNETNSPLYWTRYRHKEWDLLIAATPAGLCYVGPHEQSCGELAAWAAVRFPERVLIRDDDRLQSYAAELGEYLQGLRTSITASLDVQGTAFQLAVWDALCRIPYGQTRSYSDIAAMLHKPAAVRAVGTAIGTNPVLIAVPCHRVIGKNGALTGYRGGVFMKAQLLRLERGVPSGADRQFGHGEPVELRN